MLLLSDEISTHSDNILLLAFSTDLLQIHNSNNNVIYYLQDCVEIVLHLMTQMNCEIHLTKLKKNTLLIFIVKY